MSRVSQLGRHIRSCRHKLGLTLPALADATGVQKSTLSKIENGMGNPSLDTLVSIAKGLQVSVGHMLSVAFNEPHESNEPIHTNSGKVLESRR